MTLFKLFLISILQAVVITQWRQNEYVIISDRCEMFAFNKSYGKNLMFGLSLFNRTTRAFNFEATLLKDLSTKVTSVAQLYKFLSNEYRLFPVTVSVNLCREIDSDLFGFGGIRNFSNIKGCPMKKGYYYIRNYLPDFSKFPPHAPSGIYKSTIKFYHEKDYVAELHWYGRIIDIIKWK